MAMSRFYLYLVVFVKAKSVDTDCLLISQCIFSSLRLISRCSNNLKRHSYRKSAKILLWIVVIKVEVYNN